MTTIVPPQVCSGDCEVHNQAGAQNAKASVKSKTRTRSKARSRRSARARTSHPSRRPPPTTKPPTVKKEPTKKAPSIKPAPAPPMPPMSAVTPSRSSRASERMIKPFGVGAVMEGRWKLGGVIGEGAFGKVYEGVDLETGENVAVKVEVAVRRRPFLRKEWEAYRGLRNTETEIFGIARPYYYGRYGGKWVMVMDCLGRSLDELVEICGGRLSVKSVAMVGIQMLRRLQLIHHKGFVHRDIKPENMLMGRGDGHRVYLVDFGLAKRYLDYETRKHIPFRKGLSFMGTSRYASMSAHRGWEQGRKDDVEALGFVLVYLLNGELPWQGLDESDMSRKAKRVGGIKERMGVEGLCRAMPELVQFFAIVRAYRFEERPDYSRLRAILRGGLKRYRYVEDRVFDWMKK